MRAEDVAEEIELLNSHLTKLGINLFNTDIDWDDNFLWKAMIVSVMV